MSKRILVGLLMAGLCVVHANAACSWTTLTNGTAADANQVMNNLDCLAPLANPAFTGNVGIGTAVPDAPLDVETIDTGTGTQTISGIFGRVGASPNTAAREAGIIFSDAANPTFTGGITGIRQNSSGNYLGGLGFYVNETGATPASTFLNLTRVMTINASGNVGIGTATPGQLLDVAGNMQVDGTYFLFDTTGDSVIRKTTAGIIDISSGGGTNDVRINFDYGGGSGGLSIFDGNTVNNVNLSATSGNLVITPSNGHVGIGTATPSYTLQVNGSVAGTSAYNNLSDERLKKNIRSIPNAMQIIEQIHGVSFQWRTPAERRVGQKLNLPIGESQVGFIAQDLRKVLPQAVSVAKSKEAIMSVAESKVVPILVEALKQLKASNDRQEAEIREMRVQISTLQRKPGVRAAQN